MMSTGADGIFLPSGMIHATYTMAGGYQCGITCTTANAITVVTNCVSRELARPVEKGRRANNLGAMNVYYRCLEYVFKSRQEELIGQAFSAWINF